MSSPKRLTADPAPSSFAINILRTKRTLVKPGMNLIGFKHMIWLGFAQMLLMNNLTC